MVWLYGNTLYTRIKNGTYCHQEPGEPLPPIGTVTPGVWHKVEIQASWQADPSGYFKVWFDNTKVIDKRSISTTVGDPESFDFRVGLYANGWHDDGGMKGSQGTRQVWMDEVGIGSEFKDADPDQW